MKLKNAWKAIKGFFTKGLKAKIFTAIDGLDKFEKPLGEVINNIIEPEKRAKAAMDFLQKKLKESVEAIL